MWLLEIFFHWRWLWLTLTQRSWWLTEVRMPCSQISPVAGVWCWCTPLGCPVLRSALWLGFDVVCWIWMGLNPKHSEMKCWSLRNILFDLSFLWIHIQKPDSLERLLFWQSAIQFLLSVKGLPACIAAWIHGAITVVRLLIGCLLSVFYYCFVFIVLVIFGVLMLRTHLFRFVESLKSLQELVALYCIEFLTFLSNSLHNFYCVV